MKKVFAKFATGVTFTTALLASTLTGPPAGAATDAYPCGGQWWHSGWQVNVQNCPDWAPGDQNIAVYEFNAAYSGVSIVGWIYAPGDDWYACQFKGAALGSGPNRNDWWALTVADNGKPGWVNQIYFRGGGNDEPDANLRICPLRDVPNQLDTYSGAEAFNLIKGT